MAGFNTNSPETANNPDKDKLSFKYLPGYANFILENYLEQYTLELIKNFREENFPLLAFFSHLTDEEFIDISKKSSQVFFTYLAENNARDYIIKSLNEYIKNQSPFFEREQILAEDITIISFIRRKTIRKFLRLYTEDFELFSKVMNETDRFVSETESATFNAFLNIQQEKLNGMNIVLAQREQELLEMQELADMGSFTWNLEGGKSYFTPGLMKIFEMTDTSNLETFLLDVHEDDRDNLRESIQQSYIQGNFECEYRFIKNNLEKKIWSRGKVIFKDGNPSYMKGTIMDVTKKDKILQQLQDSEDLHKQAQAITHIGNWSWELASNKIEWSDELYRIYGLEPQSEEITFERFVSLIHPEDREQRIQEIQESLSSGVAKDYVIRIINPDGTMKVLRGKGQVLIDKNNIPIKMVGTCQDITRSYNLNKELQEKEEHLQKIISNAPDSVIVIDENSIITLWNPKTEEIFGWKSEEVLGSHLTETIIPPQYREAHTAGMKRLLETGVTKILNKTLEITALNKAGHEFYVSLTISQSMQYGHKSFIAFLRDISKEKQTKVDLQIKTDQLEELNESLKFKNYELEGMNRELESFNYIASHDLQEPLRKIQIFTNRILEKGVSNLPSSTVDYLEKIRNSSTRMKMLIEDLLLFSQSVGNSENLEPTDLNMLLENVQTELSTIIEEKHVTITSSTLPVLNVVPFQFQQVLLNLISNAIKYSVLGIPPQISITWSIVKGLNLHIQGAVPGKNYVEMIVKDNGIGFDNNYAEKIFGLFQRLHGKEEYSGTGIGLAICKKIIHNYKGFIIANSTPGKGSSFYIYLPYESIVH